MLQASLLDNYRHSLYGKNREFGGKYFVWAKIFQIPKKNSPRSTSRVEPPQPSQPLPHASEAFKSG
jgi:hypothetical protein